jgi:hypothetical protein
MASQNIVPPGSCNVKMRVNPAVAQLTITFSGLVKAQPIETSQLLATSRPVSGEGR